MKEEVIEIPLENIHVNPYQPRRDFSNEELEELAQSIKKIGIIHPPVVRPKEGATSFELISGERRLRASKLAGLQTIKVLVKPSSHFFSAQAALIENVQRVDLNPIEIAKALKSLIDEFGFQQDKLAEQIGKKRSTISNYLRLLSLPKKIQEGVSQNLISMGHAKAILSLNKLDQQTLLFDIILKEELNVREAEKRAQSIEQKYKQKKLKYENEDFYLNFLAEKIQHKIGAKVSLQNRGKGGRLIIDYLNEDLERILMQLGIEEN